MFARFICILLAASGLTGDASRLLADEASREPKVQAVISLEQAIELVKKKHPDIRLQEAAVLKASEEARLASRAFLPDLDLDFILSSASGGWGLIVTAAKLLAPVFSFKNLIRERDAKKILKEKEDVLIWHREREAAHAVKELYVLLLIQRELSRILSENASRAKKRFELIRIRHGGGRLTDEELLSERLRFETALAQTGKGSAWLRSSEFVFERLAGLPLGEPFSLAPIPLSDPGTFPLAFAQCLETAYERNVFLSALFLEEEASLKRLGVKAPGFRSEGAFLGLGESKSGLFSGRPRFGFTGNWVLYDWGKRRLLEGIKGIEHKELTLKHEKEFQAFEETLAKSYFELERLQNDISETRAKSKLLRESERRGRILERMGRLRQSELLSLENEVRLQKTEDWRKRLEYFLVCERLLKDMGLSNLEELKEAASP